MIKIITNLYFTTSNPVPLRYNESSTKILELRTEDDCIYGKTYLKVATDSAGNNWYAETLTSGATDDNSIEKYSNGYLAIGSRDYDLSYPALIGNTGLQIVFSRNQDKYSKSDSFTVYLQRQATDNDYTVNYVLGEGKAEDPANYSDYEGSTGVVSTGSITGTEKTPIGEIQDGVPNWISVYISKGGSKLSDYSRANLYAFVEPSPFKPEKNQTLRQIYPSVPTNIDRVPDKLDLSEYDSLQNFFKDYSTSSDIIYDVQSYTNPDTVPSDLEPDALYLGEQNSSQSSTGFYLSGYILSQYKQVAWLHNGSISYSDMRPIMEITSNLPFGTYENRVKYQATNNSPLNFDFYTQEQINSLDLQDNRVTDSVVKYLWYNGNRSSFNFPGTGTLYKINGLRPQNSFIGISGIEVPNTYTHNVNGLALTQELGESHWTITYGIYDEKQYPGRQTINEYADSTTTVIPFRWCFNGNFTLQGLLDEIDSYRGSSQGYTSFDSFLQNYDFIEDPDMTQVVYDVDFSYGSHVFDKESAFDSSISPSNLSSATFRTADGVFSLNTVLVNNDGLSLRKHYTTEVPDSIFQRTVSETTPFGSHTFLQLIGESVDDETGETSSQLGSVYRYGGGTTGDTIDTLIITPDSIGFSSSGESYSLTRIYGSYTYLGVNCANIEWPEIMDSQDGYRCALYWSTYTESQSGINRFYFYIPESYSGKEINFSIPGFSQINLVGPDIDISKFSGYTEYRTYRDGNIVTLYPSNS